jgi:hypothetical protein
MVVVTSLARSPEDARKHTEKRVGAGPAGEPKLDVELTGGADCRSFVGLILADKRIPAFHHILKPGSDHVQKALHRPEGNRPAR